MGKRLRNSRRRNKGPRAPHVPRASRASRASRAPRAPQIGGRVFAAMWLMAADLVPALVFTEDRATRIVAWVVAGAIAILTLNPIPPRP